jgi:hypothetical protein
MIFLHIVDDYFLADITTDIFWIFFGEVVLKIF